MKTRKNVVFALNVVFIQEAMFGWRRGKMSYLCWMSSLFRRPRTDEDEEKCRSCIECRLLLRRPCTDEDEEKCRICIECRLLLRRPCSDEDEEKCRICIECRLYSGGRVRMKTRTSWRVSSWWRISTAIISSSFLRFEPFNLSVLQISSIMLSFTNLSFIGWS